MKSFISVITIAALARAQDAAAEDEKDNEKWVYKASSFGATQTPLLQDGADLGITVSWGSTTFVKTDLEHVILWMGTETGGARITSGTMVQTYLSFPDPDAPGNS